MSVFLFSPCFFPSCTYLWIRTGKMSISQLSVYLCSSLPHYYFAQKGDKVHSKSTQLYPNRSIIACLTVYLPFFVALALKSTQERTATAIQLFLSSTTWIMMLKQHKEVYTLSSLPSVCSDCQCQSFFSIIDSVSFISLLFHSRPFLLIILLLFCCHRPTFLSLLCRLNDESEQTIIVHHSSYFSLSSSMRFLSLLQP